MKNLTLGDLLLALPDLLDRRAGALEGLLCGQLFLPQVKEVWGQISALPLLATSSEKFVAQLSAADAQHDSCAAALCLFTDAYQRLPDLTANEAALLATAKPVIPESVEVRGSYATQASRAQEREQAVTAEQRQALAHFPLTRDRTFVDLFDAYVAAGREIDTLLRQRADAASEDTTDRSSAARLRSSALGILGQLRGALASELRADPQRATNIDKQVFAYVDLLQANRDKGGPAAPSPPAPPAS